MIYVVWLEEGFEESRILAAYYSKQDADSHCTRLNNMDNYLDECTYKVTSLEVQ